jgi:hypothetical protein
MSKQQEVYSKLICFKKRREKKTESLKHVKKAQHGKIENVKGF